MSSFFQLLSKRSFLPLFITQLLQAFNDNAYKSAMAILIAYQLATSSQNASMKITLGTGLFILPFFLFSSLAGQLADKFDKASLTRIIKTVELGLISLGAAAFYLHHEVLLFVTLFLIGAHSAFFGPIKYAILPEQLEQNELIRANALLEASTFIAILLGTIIGANLINAIGGTVTLSILLLTCSVGGWISSFYIPQTGAKAPELNISLNIFRETWNIISTAKKNRIVFMAILGISWFWLIGAVYLQEFIPFAKDNFHADSTVVTLFQTMFTIGIAIGSLLCNRLIDNDITAKYVPLGILLVSVCTIDLAVSASQITPPTGEYITVSQFFLQSFTHYHVLVDIIGLALFGGIYIVPLYAIMQAKSDESYRSRIVAANNIINALFMVIGSAITLGLHYLNFSVIQVLSVLAIANTLVAIYICKMLPEAIIKSFFNWILKAIYRVEVKGLENYRAAGDKVIIIANHTSFLDAVLLSAFLPDKFAFAVNAEVAAQWWLKPFLYLAETFPVDPTNPMATKSIIRQINAGKKCMIFPEGRLTTTGALMKVYEGPGLIAYKTGAMIVPVRIDGAQYTIFSRLKGKVRTRLFPKITLTILPAWQFAPGAYESGQDRREMFALKLYKVMTDMVYESSHRPQSLFSAVLDAQKIHGKNKIIAEDTDRTPITYHQFILRSFLLGKMIAKRSEHREKIGLLLPTSVGGMVTFFACHAYGRIPAMLNFSAGLQSLLAACNLAQIKTIYSSKRFVETAKLEDVVEGLSAAGYHVIYLDELRSSITLWTKIRALLTTKFANWMDAYYEQIIRPDDPAVVLFTSGSEGSPKGVVLSHQNLLSNCAQLMSRVDFNTKDLIFNVLPIFHSFGLTAGGILPITQGIRVFFYPSPLHYRIIPELVYDTSATIFFGTDTFLNGYARHAHPYDFYSIRYIFAGAEKLKEQTYKFWTEKFGLRIFEGYGATETSPVLSTNTPMLNQFGSVGCFMPGIQYKLQPVEGIKEGGRLFVAGPNIMLGYIRPEDPTAIDPPSQGWYDTGDIVDVDVEGFITINGRAKRFAKIGGEMISLTATEGMVRQIWPEHHHAVVAIPDAKKGEQLILLTDCPDANRESLIAYAKQHGISELTLPKTIFHVKELPILATGKMNYNQVQSVVVDLQQQAG